MNPTQPNENFQDREVRQYAEQVYLAIERKLVKAVVDTLWLVKQEVGPEENAVDPMEMEFDYAYRLLQEKGYALNHTFKEVDGEQTLIINVYKLENTFSYKAETSTSISLS